MTISRIVFAVVGMAGLVAAQNTITVRVDGVGDCTALNWTFDASHTVPPPGTVGISKAQISALVVNRQLDQCSPHLFELVVSGKHVPSVVVPVWPENPTRALRRALRVSGDCATR